MKTIANQGIDLKVNTNDTLQMRRATTMITIKKFAGLCGCTAETLRYYDRIDLLKPAMINRETGYRYYREEQLKDYNRIRELQTAGFLIDEIKGLQDLSNQEISAAIDRKILEQYQKLVYAKNIRDLYREKGRKTI